MNNSYVSIYSKSISFHMPGWLELTELMGISITYAVSRRVERRADRVNNEREVEAPSELG